MTITRTGARRTTGVFHTLYSLIIIFSGLAALLLYRLPLMGKYLSRPKAHRFPLVCRFYYNINHTAFIDILAVGRKAVLIVSIQSSNNGSSSAADRARSLHSLFHRFEEYVNNNCFDTVYAWPTTIGSRHLTRNGFNRFLWLWKREG